MTSLLHLDSSANRSGDSVSRQLTRLFADSWRAQNDSAGYRYRDLAADPVPPLTTAYCTLGRRLEQHGTVPPDRVGAVVENAAERREWEQTRLLIDELLAADTVVLGAPMYNLSVTAALKAWIDRISFPGAFVDPETGESPLRATTVVVVTARGGAYGPGTPLEGLDFQIPYLRTYFGRLGVPDERLHFAGAELTLAELVPRLAHLREPAADSIATARAELTALAAGGRLTV